MKKDTTRKLGKVIQIDEQRIHDHLGEMAHGNVEETLNALLDAEADRICHATRYERSPERQDRRAEYRKILGIAKGDNRYAGC